MIPSVKWIAKNFDRFNREYFGSRLEKPEFRCAPVCFAGGQECYATYDYNLDINFWGKVRRAITPGIITFSTKYSLPEAFCQGTLLHEMAHMYVYTVMLKFPKDPHGKEFQSIAGRIASDGWDVLEESVTKPPKELINEEKIKEIVSEVLKKITENL